MAEIFGPSGMRLVRRLLGRLRDRLKPKYLEPQHIKVVLENKYLPYHSLHGAPEYEVLPSTAKPADPKASLEQRMSLLLNKPDSDVIFTEVTDYVPQYCEAITRISEVGSAYPEVSVQPQESVVPAATSVRFLSEETTIFDFVRELGSRSSMIALAPIPSESDTDRIDGPANLEETETEPTPEELFEAWQRALEEVCAACVCDVCEINCRNGSEATCTR
jgi:hypothetical protein